MPYSTEVLADSPLGYWSLQEAAAPFVDQGSGAKNCSVTSGAPSAAQTPGPLQPIGNPSDKCLKFNGTTDAIDAIGSAAIYQLNNDFTIEFWAKNGAFPAGGSFDGLLAKYHGNTLQGWGIIYDSTGRVFIKRNNVDFQVANDANSKLSQSVFKHYVLTYDDTAHVAKWYVNGAEVSSVSITYPDTTDTTHDFGIGWEYDAGQGNNYIAHVAVYNSKLTPARILRHYAIGSAQMFPDGFDTSVSGGTLVGRIQPIAAALLLVKGVADLGAAAVGRWNVSGLFFLNVKGVIPDAAVGRIAQIALIIRNVKSRFNVRLPRR